MINKLKLLLPLSYLSYRNRLGLKKLVVTRESTIQKKMFAIIFTIRLILNCGTIYIIKALCPCYDKI